MKKGLSKFLSVLLVLSFLFTVSIPAFATDGHIQNGYGNQSGIDDRYCVWSLQVNSMLASASGYYITRRATGSVYCGVQASGNWADSNGVNSAGAALYGNGEWADVSFYTTSVFTPSYDHTLVGYGSSSGSHNNQATWALNVTSSYANSSGSMNSGYHGNVSCYVDTDSYCTSTTGFDSNYVYESGDGYAAGVSFSNIIPHITDTVDEKTAYGINSGSTSQVTWYIEAATTYASSSGSVSSGYRGMVYCAIMTDGNWYDSDAVNNNSISMLGSNTYAEIWIR